MSEEPASPAAPTPAAAKAGEFYDTAFTIEAMQRGPYENGFTWRTVIGALFIAFVMLPGVIFMGLAPILAVGFGAGLGLVGMFSIAMNFLWGSIGVE
jgi:hypothetical protein